MTFKQVIKLSVAFKQMRFKSDKGKCDSQDYDSLLYWITLVLNDKKHSERKGVMLMITAKDWEIDKGQL